MFTKEQYIVLQGYPLNHWFIAPKVSEQLPGLGRCCWPRHDIKQFLRYLEAFGETIEAFDAGNVYWVENCALMQCNFLSPMRELLQRSYNVGAILGPFVKAVLSVL